MKNYSKAKIKRLVEKMGDLTNFRDPKERLNVCDIKADFFSIISLSWSFCG